MLKLPVNRDNAIFLVGDFRDWNDVEAWASSIAQKLKASTDDSQCQVDLLGSVTTR